MSYHFPRCQILPLPDHQVSFQIDGAERLRWHFGPSYTRPFFFPLIGPSGSVLTRIGHPGAPNHDHHRSIWFAHNKVLGIDFWSENSPARIRQKEWLDYDDADEAATMAVKLGWYDGHDPKELIEQELIAAVRPGNDRETFLEIQTTFRPTAASLEFGQTNFGFFAVRVAKSISAHFGGGQLTNSEGASGEPAIFGKSARWVDYSGPVPGDSREGITYFDHPSNPSYPTGWHVREDGWMGASPGMHKPLETTRDKPLTLRYLLHAHRDDISTTRADQLAGEFVASNGFEVVKSTLKHRMFIVRRKP